MPWSYSTISSSYNSQSSPQQWVFRHSIIFIIKAVGGEREPEQEILEAFNKNIHPTGTRETWAFKLYWSNFTVNPQNSVDPAVNKSWLKTMFIPLQLWCYIQNRWPKFYLAFGVLIFENSWKESPLRSYNNIWGKKEKKRKKKRKKKRGRNSTKCLWSKIMLFPQIVIEKDFPCFKK